MPKMCPITKGACITKLCGVWNIESCLCGFLSPFDASADLYKELKSIKDELSNINGTLKGEHLRH